MDGLPEIDVPDLLAAGAEQVPERAVVGFHPHAAGDEHVAHEDNRGVGRQGVEIPGLDFLGQLQMLLIRFGAFFGVFLLPAAAEGFAPRRRLTTSKPHRWFANLAIVALNPLSVALVYPVLPVGVALLASEQGWGLLNQWALPHWLEVLVAALAPDLAA